MALVPASESVGTHSPICPGCFILCLCLAVRAAPIPWELRPGESNQAQSLSVQQVPLCICSVFQRISGFALRQGEHPFNTGPVYFLDTREIVLIFIYIYNSDPGACSSASRAYASHLKDCIQPLALKKIRIKMQSNEHINKSRQD